VIADVRALAPVVYKDLECVGHFYLPELDKFKMNDQGADFIYSGSRPVPFMLPNGLKEILDLYAWQNHTDQSNAFPMFSADEFIDNPVRHPTLNFVRIATPTLSSMLVQALKANNNVVLVASTANEHAMPALRRLMFDLVHHEVRVPVVIERTYDEADTETLLLYASTDVGGLLIDGFGDGVMLSMPQAKLPATKEKVKFLNSTAFGILQAARTRITKTEYISCPSCGRTLFDLQETTAKIRKRTDHLKGIKIGIMGCIVNGPGEMADADYGYVGSGKGKITLYRGKEVVKRNVPSDRAVDELIHLIREDGNWLEQETV
jgi:(E)-4-hydroxy-3-methylbut-2-enyl-diphosphate synthase